MKQQICFFQWGLLIVDTILIWFVFFAYGINSPHTLSDYVIMVLIYTVIILCQYAFKGYVMTLDKELLPNLISRFQGLFVAALICSFIFFITEKKLFIKELTLYFTVVFTMLLLTRTLFYLLVKNILPVLDFIIVGSKDKWKNLSMEISDSVLNKIKPVCYALPTIEQLEKCIKDNPQVRSMIVIDPSFLSNSDVRRRINYLRNNNIKVEYLPNIVENYLERVPLEVAKEFASYYEITLNTAPVRYSKRALDIALALLGLIMGLPFMAIIALWILIEDGRPVIFSQQRVGMNNKKYTMHKFRSMKNATSKEKIPAFVTEEGARILNPIGKIIRKTRMDELPQLWDVLIGNMSLIGPRPEQPQFVEQFSDELPFYDYRHHVRPGITGWAQVNFSYAATLEETAKKLEYDLYYVKNWSMLLDLSIILKTVETMLGMKGSK